MKVVDNCRLMCTHNATCQLLSEAKAAINLTDWSLGNVLLGEVCFDASAMEDWQIRYYAFLDQ